MRLPSHILNGATVALGIALIDLGLDAVAGPVAALGASTGAICASLADQPLATSRTWRRVGTGALAGWIAGLLVVGLREWGVAMGLVVMMLGFCSAMVLSWGLRAAPLSFVPVLALVFTLAAPPPAGASQILLHAGWTAVGGALYFGWSVLTSCLLQARLRTLALAGALEALASLLRSRAALHGADAQAGAPPLRDWIRSQVLLDERLQSARDLLFPAVGHPGSAEGIGVLLQAVEMRDTLLAGELDLELLGADAPAHALRESMRDRLVATADGVDEMARDLRAHGLRRAGKRVPGQAQGELPDPAAAALTAPRFEAGDPRYPLVIALSSRARQLGEVLARMRAALRGDAVAMPLAEDELQAFISPEGWPLTSLRAQWSLASPVLRHAVRLSLALGSAYFLGLVLPWASHPHWLVLSVAVVMRGNLEQTLARRNDRVLGTMIGCLLVLALAHLAAPWVAMGAFLVSVGIAHGYATRRYLVTSAAASVMALMQAHLAQPEGGFGAIERIGDTVLGAALAWAFSYLWPWWERRGVARLTERVLAGLATLADQVLRLPEPGATDLKLRRARREVYESVGAIAAAAQRTGAEPERVRVPLYALAEMLTRCHVLMAQLLAVRLLLLRRRAQLDVPEGEQWLSQARETLAHALEGASIAASSALAFDDEPSVALHATPAVAVPTEDVDHAALPAALPDGAVMPWLRRRLRLAMRAAQRVGRAALALREAAR